jgi:hypothetical protein
MIRSCPLEVWRLCQKLSAQHRIHALGCLLLDVGQHVGVGVHLLPYVGVSDYLLEPRALTPFRANSDDTPRRRAPQDGRTCALRFRALLTENGVERVELART